MSTVRRNLARSAHFKIGRYLRSPAPVGQWRCERVGIRARVVSAPSLDVFDREQAEYQNEVLGDRSRIVAIEAGRSSGWYKYVNHDALIIGIDRFGASAPLADIEKHFGFTPEAVAEKVRGWR